MLADQPELAHLTLSVNNFWDVLEFNETQLCSRIQVKQLLSLLNNLFL